jgi:tetratricopeptide (TPR) repeat protein
VLVNLKRGEEARELLEALAEEFPEDGGIKFNLAQAFELLQEDEKAEPLYREALKINPNYPPVYNKLGGLISRRQDFEEALKVLEQGLEMAPQDPNLRYSRALVLADMKRVEEAEELLTQLLKEYPNFAPARAALERLNQSTGKVARGVEEIEKDLADKPDDPTLEVELGHAHLLSRGFERAIELFEKHRESFAGNAAFMADLGYAYAGNAQQSPELLERAEEALKSSLELNSAQPAVMLQLARIALNQSKPQAAFDYAEQSETGGGESPHSANVKGYAVLQKGFAEEAMTHFQRSLELQPESNLEAISNLAQLSDFSGQVELAGKYYQQWKELAPKEVTPLMKQAMMAIRTGTPDAGIELFDDVLELKPDEASALFMQSMALKDQGRLDEAIEKLRQAVEVKPDYSEAAHYLKQMEQNRPLGLSSLTELEEGVAEDPESYDDRYLLGYIYMHMRRFKEAAEQLAKVVEHDDENYRARFELADALYHSGEKDRAIDILISLEEKIPRDPSLRFRLADMLESNEEYDLALKEFHNAAEMMPQNVNFQYRHALALINADKEDKGEEKLRQVLADQEQFAPAWIELGKLEMTTDREKSALESFDKALRYNRNLIDAIYYKGLIYRNQLQDESEALRHFRAVLGFRWESPDAHFQLGEMMRVSEPDTARQHFTMALRFWNEDNFNYQRTQSYLKELQSA